MIASLRTSALRQAASIAALGLAAAGAGAQNAAAPVAAPSTTDTRLLAQPAISATRIAFVYAGDIWTAGIDGSNVRRLTTAEGDEQNPVFSPDGEMIAFSAAYDGNIDVYVVPAAGGIPKRLTWHPGDDLAQDFTPDGRAVLFTSPRAVYTNRYTQLFTVPVEGGVETQLPIPHAAAARYSADGKRIAYNPLSPSHLQWKGYRGGRVSEVWIYDVATHAVEKVPQPAGRANDADPFWVGSTLYFRSDRDGEFNLYSYAPGGATVQRRTTHADFPVLAAGGGSGKQILYEQAGWLHLFDPASGASRRLTIGVAADLREMRPRFVGGRQYVRGIDLSPTGARAAVEYRGEIVTVPAAKGDPRNLTNTPAAHERSPAWSPDGRRIAYLSDEGGEYHLIVRQQDGRDEGRTYDLGGNGFYFNVTWAPDGQRISYEDNSQSAFVLDLASGKATRIAGNRVYGPSGISLMSHAWSPDSKWIAYTVNTQPLVNTLFVYDVDKGTSHRVTDGLSEVTEPAFDRSGKYLYVFASTNAGPVMDWFSQANADFTRTRSLYAIVLSKELPNPLAKESDEEKGPPAEGSAGDSASAKTRMTPTAPPRSASTATRIDFDGIALRILALPIPDAMLSSLRTGEPGHIYYLRSADGRTALHHYDLGTRKDERLVDNVNGYSLSADGKKLLYAQGQNFFISSSTKVTPNEGRVDVAGIQVRIDPRAEWAQIFDEAWRINRDYFYAPNMHGVDWKAARAKYAQFLPHAATRADLNRIIQWMMSELRVGHHRGGGGDRRDPPTTVPGGLLGADYTVHQNRYRITKVYGGLNWNPELRSPLTEPGVNGRAGEYIIAVNGVDLRPPTNLYSAFENTAGKITDLTIGPNPDGRGARTVQVVPVPNEAGLRNRAWVEENLRKVDSATNGRVAYVYVPNTSTAGHEYFKRYFYPQAHKEGIIVDERHNGGGSYADYYIDILRRPQISYWAMRYGDDLPTPTAAIHGPKAMIIDETAGSGGDLLPWMFRKLDMGPLIGKRTWGGLVGILGYPVLMDGGGITAPNFAFWTPEEGFLVENVGVPPDIEVEQTPAAVIAGGDPQLERAIAVVMEALEKSPPPKIQRPPYPDKTRP